MIERGFKSIAYLGVHAPPLVSSAKEWSSERESGWARALREAGLPYHGMALWPDDEVNDDAAGAREIGRSFADELFQRGDIRGVVAANDAVALGLIDALCQANVPRDEWPAIVAFDNSPEARRHNITSLHLPWDEIGREAADLVWSRAHNQLPTATPTPRGADALDSAPLVPRKMAHIFSIFHARCFLKSLANFPVNARKRPTLTANFAWPRFLALKHHV